jgi:DinB superfamily
MNPYASHLGNQDPIRVLESTASRLTELSQSLGQARMNQAPAPGKWSAREIITHLADCEIAFGIRYRQALAENNHVIQPFDQDQWAKCYAAYDAAQALSTFAALRNWNLALLRSLTPEQLAKPLSHPERGKMILRTLIETSAGHDINHLRQLETIANKSAA